MTRIEMLRIYGGRKECGTRAKYISGCRCVKCRAANSAYQCERERRRAAGESNPLVDAAPAREHIRSLSKQGIGYKTVAEYSGVGKSTLFQIAKGERVQVRRNTLDAILAVDRSCYSAGTLLPANEVWKQIKWMRTEGFTDREIARRAGIRCGHLQIGSKRVTGKTAVAIDKVYRIARLGE